ncbi:DUF899 family protein [Georgenia alba]|uniref:DUF899 family protein n=1 Tax=Georgenia alba TaxID=2233858 RepID=A0ABW2Q9I1_9MICO
MAMTITENVAAPPVVDPEVWQREREALLVREKAHTREGDAIAAARRRLPMYEVDAGAVLVGDGGERTLEEVFDDRSQLILKKHMFHTGKPLEHQCMGCTYNIWNIHDASYLHAEDVTFAVVADGPWSEVAPFRDFMGYQVPWYSSERLDRDGLEHLFGGTWGGFAFYLRRGESVYLTYETTARGNDRFMPALNLLDSTVYGRQEEWEDSPEGWPQRPTFTHWRTDEHGNAIGARGHGRPTPQWTRPGATPVGGTHRAPDWPGLE